MPVSQDLPVERVAARCYWPKRRRIPSAPLTTLFARLARNSDSRNDSTIQGKRKPRGWRVSCYSHHGRMPEACLLRSHFEYALGS